MVMAARSGIRFAALAAVMLMGGCSTAGPTGACQCPKPVAYNEATIEAITAALKALPPNSVLLAAMDDYEDERYNLRHCTGGQ
jgi:hypothetical protein